MSDKIIIMPNGDGVLASTITSVEYRPAHHDNVLEMDFADTVYVGTRGETRRNYEAAVTERDRILAEWHAWHELSEARLRMARAE